MIDFRVASLPTTHGENLVLPFGKDVVKDSPDVADASHLDADEQQGLYSYYQQYLTGTGTGFTAGTIGLGTTGSPS